MVSIDSKKKEMIGRFKNSGKTPLVQGLYRPRAAISMEEPPVSVGAAFVREGVVPRAIEWLKWPTCSRREKAPLLQRLSEVTGESFGEIEGGEYEAVVVHRLSAAE